MNRKPKGYWVFETCKQEALLYNTKGDFSKFSYQAYDVSRVNNWLNEICEHMVSKYKPKNYWTFERCCEEALKYQHRDEFRKNIQTVYNKCLKEGWLDQACSHMTYINKPKGYWNYDNCKEEAIKYSNVVDFKNNASTAHRTCTINKWLDDVCSHMNRRLIWTFDECEKEAKKFNKLGDFRKQSQSCYITICSNDWIQLISHMEREQKPDGYWTKERCKEEALKYTTKEEFRKNCSSGFSITYREKWNEEVFSHMDEINKPWGYWTKEKCHEEALKYTNYTDFRENSASACSSAKYKGWFDEITNHFKSKGSWYKRFIYAYEFPDNHVYVGLTHDIINRHKQHLIEGSVFDYSIESRLIPNLKQLTDNPVEVEEAIKLERFYLQEYISNGWVPLNRAKPGALGGGIRKWSMENLQLEALKYENKKSFRENSNSAYSTAKRLKILDEICKHMNFKERHPAGYWTKLKCQEEANKYETIADFRTNSPKAYGAASNNMWLYYITKNMKKR